MTLRTMRALIFLLFVLFFASRSEARAFKINVKTDARKALIGEQIRVSYNIETGARTPVKLPALPDSIGRLEITKMQPDTIYKGAKKLIQFNLNVTSFDSGSYIVPSLPFEYEIGGVDSLIRVYSDSVYLQFATVPVDTAKPFKDIKGPMDVNFSLFWEKFVYVLYALGVIAVLVLVYYYIKKMKKAKPEEPEYDPKIPSHVIAIEALRKLESEKLWQKGQTKLYYTKLIDILRKYIERRFRFNAMEMTSSEIIDELQRRKYPEEKISPLRMAQELAEMPKFAKMEPLPDDNNKAMRFAIEFVELSIVIPIPTPEENAGGETDVQ